MTFDPRAFLKDFPIPQAGGKPSRKRKVVKLVKPKPILRPIGTRYYNDLGAKQGDHASCGASSSVVNAVGAAVTNIIGGHRAKALIFDRVTGKVIHMLAPERDGMKILDAQFKLRERGNDR